MRRTTSAALPVGLPAALLVGLLLATPVTGDDSARTAAPVPEAARASRSGAALPARQRLAAAYSAACKGVSMLVMIDGKVVFEDYPGAADATRAHKLASGTKSFSGAIAVAAQMDGLLTLDERVAETIGEWQADPLRSKITIRQLLGLTSGLDPGKNLRAPTYAAAIAYEAEARAGTRFRYGPVPFQVFGEVMRRKLAAREGAQPEDPVAYLTRRVLDPIGLEVAGWARAPDGNPYLPHGAELTAREWAKFGELVRLGGRHGKARVLDGKLLDECFQPGKVFPKYGMTWWLPRPKRRTRVALPDDLVLAAGLGDQRLWISRSEKLVVVRQAPLWNKGGFDDDEFLARLLHGKDARGRAPEAPPPPEPRRPPPPR